MTHRSFTPRLVLLFTILITLPMLAQLRVTQFSADMKTTGKGMTSTGKMYFGGQKVRMEMTAQGHQSIMITNSQRKVSYMLMPDQHMYMEMSTEMAAAKRSTPDIRTYDPSNPCANSPDTTCQRLGPGTADGRLCDKWLFRHKSSSATQTVWIDMKTGIAIRSESSDGMVWELTNIKEGAQAASLFELPAGYTKLDMGAMMKSRQSE